MCGIVGFCPPQNRSVDIDILLKMRDTLTHRGPDDAGVYVSDDKHIGLAHRRLSILDLSQAGHQPMPSPDKSLWITFNGEIYNFQEIRKELVKKGYKFSSQSDTEVILYAYQEYGAACVEHFNGMFAFVIYDATQKLLFLARDRFGIKPLYYGFLPDKTFAFASELKAIAVHPAFEKSLCYASVGEYFQYRYIPAPRTIWKNIFKLPHGHCGIFQIGARNFSSYQYYSLVNNLQKRHSATIAEVETYLSDAVQKRLISDVEVGTFLSGGVDSSAISVIAKGYHPDIRSFSIGFVPEEYSELPYSTLVANHIQTHHITEVVKNFDDDLLRQLTYHYDEPLADSSCVPTYILCRMVARYVKVALSGDGGDEVFAGYNWYNTYLNDLSSKKQQKKYNLRSVLKRMFGIQPCYFPDFENYYNSLLLNRFDLEKFRQFFAPEVYRAFIREHVSLFERYTRNPFKDVRFAQYIDLNTFMIDDILTKVDRASMAHSLEVRVPFLDHRLVETVFALPEQEFPSISTGKPILKKIIADKLPTEILNRAKKGFSAPVATWRGFDDASRTLLEGRTIQDGLFQKQFVVDLIENVYPNSQAMLWMGFLFEKWYQQWFNN